MTFTTKHWLFLGLGVLLVGVLSFSAGRFSAPAETIKLETERVVYKDKIVTVEKVVDRTKKAEVIYREIYIAMDGGTSIKETIKTDTAVNTTSDKTEDKDKSGQADKLRETKITLQPKWRVGVQAGASAVTPLLPITGPLVVGVEVDYRIVGGVSAGVWGNTVGAGGLAISVEF